MKGILLVLVGLVVLTIVKCQNEPAHIDELLYEEYEEDDEEGAGKSTTTRRTRTTTTALPEIGLATNASASPTVERNHTFVTTPVNGSIFGSKVTLNANPKVTTERVHYVLNQVGGIWNNVGSLNITGIVDQALGIRNSQIARPIVTGILNVVFCNPLTFSNNNCRKSG